MTLSYTVQEDRLEIQVSEETVHYDSGAAFWPAPSGKRYDLTCTDNRTRFTLPDAPAQKGLLLFVNGLGPYPEDSYLLSGRTFDFLGHELDPEDVLTLITQEQ